MIRNTFVLAVIVFIEFTCFKSICAQDLTEEVVFSDYKYLPGYAFRKAKHPEIFHGNKKKRNYFEGWYFKMISNDGESILSVIPGISLSEDGKEKHAFIQFIDGKAAETDYYAFPIEQFKFSEKEFAIKIENNYFSKDKLVLNIQHDSLRITGEVSMTNQIEFPSRGVLNSGIMGWYKFVPFMECYHGVVSLNHDLAGSILKNGKFYEFNKGLGYIEKDWGSSMPSAWIWMQSNHFKHDQTSFMLSVANIPWIGSSFTGFLGFLIHDDKLYKFATYTKAKLNIDKFGTDTVLISIRDKRNKFFIEASRNNSGILKAPVKGSMDRRIAESIDAKLKLTVYDKKGIVIFNDSTNIAGFEQVGDMKILLD